MAEDKKEQEMKEQIAVFLRKKDYYDILGIPKTAQDPEIKKAYKKLALRFHPDKNRTEGSKKVFEKVSCAYSTLVDPEKRASYDRYGPEEDRQPQFRTNRQYQRQGYTQEDEFEQIFRAFFGGAGARYQNNHYQHFTFNMGGARAQNNQQGQQGNSNFFYFFIFIIILYVIPALIGKQKPYFSQTSSSVYRFKVKTPILEAPYFVREEFFRPDELTQAVKKGIEEKIDTEYLIKLKRDCDNATWTKNKLLYQARESAGTARAQTYTDRAAAVDLTSCKRFAFLREKYPDYIANLFYYY